VSLMPEGGQAVSYPLEKLSAASQALAKKLAAP